MSYLNTLFGILIVKEGILKLQESQNLNSIFQLNYTRYEKIL